MSAVSSYSLAVDDDGSVYAWGSASSEHSVVLSEDSKVYGLGRNANGQLGDGTLDNKSVPTMVPPLVFVITDVTFDGVSGTGLTNNLDGTWSVTTPSHAGGFVDMHVFSTLAGTPQPPRIYSDGFMLELSPTISGLPDEATAGLAYDFEFTVVGFPAPVVSVSAGSLPGGFAPWEEVTFLMYSDPVDLGSVVADTEGNVSLTFTVPSNTVAGAHRVVAMQGGVDAEATFTVLEGADEPLPTPPAEVVPPVDDPLPTGNDGDLLPPNAEPLERLSETGADLGRIAVWALALLLGGASLVGATAWVRKRRLSLTR
ncbi:hypothetical protein [Lysinibacter sp. HNR]|uniref:hypothetical protein n=1 Tax=Lysinibacter sp. HNR TaxID=3031408 RepID=UPI0024357FB0|nr:hypothetical protein [Lysinibacter sp. HNR]WGD37526.1 hypothetical protein FrondiHNR_00965 [Lysinibacter sp. HNR]